jgi:hypothetical protein
MAHDDDVNYGSLMAEQGHEGLLGDNGIPQPDHAVLAARSEQVNGSVQVETPHTLARTWKEVDKHQSAVRMSTKNWFRSDLVSPVSKYATNRNYLM